MTIRRWWRRRGAVHPTRDRRQVWVDLVAPDETSRRAAELAAELRAEAQRLAGAAAALNEPTVIITERVRVPGYLAYVEEDGW